MINPFIKDILIRGPHNKEGKNIIFMAHSIKIVESLYLPYLTLEVNIKDDINFVENFGISGQEIIEITLRDAVNDGQVSDEDLEDYKIPFVVTKIANYTKVDKNTQTYTLMAVSKHAFASVFKSICRPHNLGFEKEVANILRTIQASELLDTNGAKIGSPLAKGIICRQSPLEALEYFRSITCDESGGPVYIHQTLVGDILISTHSGMVQERGDPYASYDNYPYIMNEADDPKALADERRHKIANFKSDLNMSKFTQGQRGAYGAKRELIEISTKTRVVQEYKMSPNPSKQMNDGEVFNKTFLPNGSQAINEITEAAHRVIPLNAQSNTPVSNSHFYIQKHDAIEELMDNIVSEFDLRILKSIDPEIQDLYIEGSDAEDRLDGSIWDTVLSGSYVVSGVVHEFADDNVYRNSVRAIKDV
jgi:hypothetical protein